MALFAGALALLVQTWAQAHLPGHPGRRGDDDGAGLGGRVRRAARSASSSAGGPCSAGCWCSGRCTSPSWAPAAAARTSWRAGQRRGHRRGAARRPGLTGDAPGGAAARAAGRTSAASRLRPPARPAARVRGTARAGRASRCGSPPRADVAVHVLELVAALARRKAVPAGGLGQCRQRVGVDGHRDQLALRLDHPVGGPVGDRGDRAPRRPPPPAPRRRGRSPTVEVPSLISTIRAGGGSRRHRRGRASALSEASTASPIAVLGPRVSPSMAWSTRRARSSAAPPPRRCRRTRPARR